MPKFSSSLAALARINHSIYVFEVLARIYLYTFTHTHTHTHTLNLNCACTLCFQKVGRGAIPAVAPGAIFPIDTPLAENMPVM